MKTLLVLWASVLSINAYTQNPYSIEWIQCHGGSLAEIATSIKTLSDGKIALLGSTTSSDGDVSGHHSGFDYWVVLLDSEGEIIWQRSIGGTGDDEAAKMIIASNDDIVICGGTRSLDGDVTWLSSRTFTLYDF